MTNKEIRKKALRLFNDNLTLIAFMALMLSIFQVVVSVASVITFEAVGANTLISMLSMFVTAPITICMYNVYSMLIHGAKVHKGYLFEWLGDFKLIWHSVKVQLMFAFRMVPWAFLVSLIYAFIMSMLTGYSQFFVIPETVHIAVIGGFFIIAMLFLVYQAFRYQGGVYECAAVPMKIITPVFHIGMVKMKYNLKDYIKLMISYAPLVIIFSGPVLAYEIITAKYDAIYYALLVFQTVGTSFVINPLIGISGMMRYSVGGKIPPEHFFQSFGMKMPKEYTGENVNADGVAEKPEITDPEPIPREENPSQPGNIGDIPFDNAPSSEDDTVDEEQE